MSGMFSVASGSNQKSSTIIDLYADLPPIKNQRLKLTSLTPFTPSYVQSNLTQTSDPAGIYATRVRGRQILLENPAKESRAKKERDAKRQRRTKDAKRRALGVIGKKEAKEKGIWQILESQTKQVVLSSMTGYMSELLGLATAPPSYIPPTAPSMPGAAGMHAKLVKADFHGSIMTVRQSKNPCLVGLSGIVIHETENAFKVVTKKDQLKLLPKQHSVFSFAVPLYSTVPQQAPGSSPSSTSTTIQIPAAPSVTSTVLEGPHIEFELHGNQFRFRAADRAGRKFKHKETIEL